MKPGWQTTEWWATTIGQVLALLTLVGLAGAVPAEQPPPAAAAAVSHCPTCCCGNDCPCDPCRCRPVSRSVVLTRALLPWRRMVEQRLQALEQNRQQEPPNPPLQQLPIEGPPRQLLPIEGQPKQLLPIEGAPKQPLPIEGQPKQPLPPSGSPKQELPQQAPRQELPATPANPGVPQRLPAIPQASTYRHYKSTPRIQSYTKATMRR